MVKGMADILGLDEADLREKCADSKSQYKRLAQKVDADVEKQIRTYIDDNGLTGCIYLQNNTKRYYPYSTLASQIVGFANDNGGAYGLDEAVRQRAWKLVSLSSMTFPHELARVLLLEQLYRAECIIRKVPYHH